MQHSEVKFQLGWMRTVKWLELALLLGCCDVNPVRGESVQIDEHGNIKGTPFKRCHSVIFLGRHLDVAVCCAATGEVVADANGNDGSGQDIVGCGGKSCVGVPVWEVTEPDINVWLRDTPLLYNASRGKNVEYNLAYKNSQGSQGDIDNGTAGLFSAGSHWHTPWRSYLEAISGSTSNFWVYLGDGSALKHSLDLIQFQNYSKLTQVSGTNVLQFFDGSMNRYGLSTSIGGVTRYFLTTKHDVNGNVTEFQYTTNASTITLNKVIDVDKREITFEYVQAGNYSNVISKVIAPYGLSATMKYNSSGQLTNLTDVVGLSSSMQYTSGNLTSLVTPYGTNTFTYFSTAGSMSAVKVSEQAVRNHFFLYYQQVDGGKVPSSYASYVPSTTNAPYFSIPNTFDTEDSHKRNSFYWNPRNYEDLSSTVKTALNGGSFTVTDLTSGDYARAKMQHWLKAYGSTNTSLTVSLIRESSPDGTTQGLIQWFDYPNKEGGAKDKEGTTGKACIGGNKLETGESTFSCNERNFLGRTTNQVDTYTGLNGLVQVRTNQYVFDSNGIDLIKHIQLIGDTSRQVVSNAFNSNHQIITSFDALGQTNQYLYNANNQLVSSKGPSGLTVTNLYETSGTWSNFLKQTAQIEISSTNSYTYTNGNPLTVTDPRGLIITNSWDSLGRLTKRALSDGTTETRVYSKLDLVQSIDRRNGTNQFAYNGFRQKTTEVDPRGCTNAYSYCNCGVLDSITDPSGKTTSFSYDLKGRRTAVAYPAGGSVTNFYNLMGQVSRVADSAGNGVTNCFNNQGLFCVASNASGRIKCITYDLENHPIEVLDPNQLSTKTTFDSLGRTIGQTNANSKVESYLYSSLGLMVYNDQLSQSTKYWYDAGGRRTSETNANGEVTSYSYNGAGDLIKLVDGKGQQTTWGHDSYGRVTSKTNAAGTEILRYKYDADGNLTNRWSITKGDTGYAYDANRNLTLVQYPSGSTVTFQYDANNRLTNMVDSVGTTTYKYTDFGALLSEDGPWVNDTVTYSYTTNRLPSKVSLLQPSASPWEVAFGYDLANRITSVASPAGSFSYLYDPICLQMVSKIGLPNSSLITNTFDTVGRRTGTYLKDSGATTLNSHTYVYDDANKRTKQTRTEGNFVDYSYDASGQLIAAFGKESGGTTNRLNERFGYFYDAAGNLNRRTNDALIQTFNVNNLNQLTSGSRSGTLTVAGTTTVPSTNVTVNTLAATLYTDSSFAKGGFSLVNGDNTFTAVGKDNQGRQDTQAITVNLPSAPSYSYDGNGNLLSDGRRTLIYDDENQLTQVYETNKWRSDFLYDGKMRRRVTKEYQWVNGKWVQTNECRYVYDRNLVIQERDGRNQPLVSYTRGRDLSGSLQGAGGIGGLLARSDMALQTHIFYHADVNGNITALQDQKQIVVGKYLYDPFGNVLAANGQMAEVNRYRFSSKEAHVNSGLIYYLYRYYDPNLQRWPNRDPIQEPGGINLYQYALNAPIDLVDYWGLAVGGCKTDAKCLGCITYSEARGSSDSCQKAVADTIKNRAISANRPICDVIADAGQFMGFGNSNYSECCNDKCRDIPNGQQKKTERDRAFKNAPADVASEFAGDASYFNSGGFVPRWIDQRIRNGSMSEVRVPGCDKFRFFKIN